MMGAASDAATTSVRAKGWRTLTQINGASIPMSKAGKSVFRPLTNRQHDVSNQQNPENSAGHAPFSMPV
jgi:hypothetical protein